jgi:hypothetical protein
MPRAHTRGTLQTPGTAHPAPRRPHRHLLLWKPLAATDSGGVYIRHARAAPPLRLVIGISVVSCVCLWILVRVMWSRLLLTPCAFCTCW